MSTPTTPAAAARSVTSAAGLLRLALATARRERLAHGAVSPELWTVIEAAALELERRLDELERAKRLAGVR